MEIDAWLAAAIADVRKRGLEDVAPFLTALSRLTETLRTTDFEGADAELAAREKARKDSPADSAARGGR